MRKLPTLTLSLLVLISITAAAPLQVEVQKLLGAEVSSDTTVTVENKSVQARQSQAFSIFQTHGDDIIKPGNGITGELELTFDCGGADVCRGDFWLVIDGERYFAEGNTYWASTGETVTVTVHANAPIDTGVYIGKWY